MDSDVNEELLPPREGTLSRFQRSEREAERLLTLKKIVADLSDGSVDRETFTRTLDLAKRERIGAVLVAPVRIGAAKRRLAGSGVKVVCRVGGDGETLPSVKKYEAKKAVQAGAEEIRLVPCFTAIAAGNASVLKKEVRRVRKAAKGRRVVVALDGEGMGEREVALATHAACDAKANGVCVRGEMRSLLVAAEAGEGRIAAECSGVESAEDFRALKEVGASRLLTSSLPLLLSLFPRVPAHSEGV